MDDQPNEIYVNVGGELQLNAASNAAASRTNGDVSGWSANLAAWGDVNGDGLLDIVMASRSIPGYSTECRAPRLR